MYRPDVRVLDCTIRDGGLMNDWRFPKAMVKDVFHTLAHAGVDYIELGYRADKAQFSPEDYGPWRFCDEEDLREVAYPCDAKVAVMCDVGRTDPDTLLPADESIIKLIRVATYVQDMPKAIELGALAKRLGYEVSVNIMAVSHVLEPDLDRALDELAATDFDMVYLVDSFGSFYSEQIHYLTEKYLTRIGGKQLGIHCHNNQQLAYANTIEGVLRGITCVDATVYGIGRAAGNCPLELILPFLKNPRYDVRPVLDLIMTYFEALRDELRWGYEMPYAITGLLNKHPRAAKSLLEGEGAPRYGAFWDELLHVDDA